MPLIPVAQRPNFRIVPSREFSCSHLEEYPVWSEFYDYEEREEIVSWGYDRDWLEQELARNHTGSEHAYYPLLDVNPFPERMLIYIHAQFQTPSGQKLSGYIVNADAHPALFVCYKGQEFGFNRQLIEAGRKDENHLRRLLPDSSLPIFPMTYTTDFTDAEGQPITGVFDFDTV